MGMKAVIHSLSGAGRLEWDTDRETAIDRIAAVASCSRLGSALFTLKFVNRASSYKVATEEMAKRSARRIPRTSMTMRRKVCQLALEEWLLDQCTTCGGRGITIKKNGVYRPCKKCAITPRMTGRRQYKQFERAQALGVDMKEFSKWETRIESMKTVIFKEHAESLAKIRQVLGWDEDLA